MGTLRVVLGWIALFIIWSAPIVFKKRGSQFWQTGFLWKYLLYFFGAWVLQLILYFVVGTIVGLMVVDVIFGGDPGYIPIYAVLVLPGLAEIVIASWLIFWRH